jgi:DNA modification methylase
MAKWPIDRLETREISALIPYARNARTHTDEQIAQIAASIREWGWTNPILIDEEGGIIAGHGRVLAAQQLGLDRVPAAIAEGWTEAQKVACRLADNQLALNAGWDLEILSSEVKGLREWGFDLSLLGFADFDALLADKTEGLTDPDAAPPLSEHPVSQTGDLWLLGRHRLLCGDSTVATDVERVLAGVEPHLMVTDPPYGVNYDPDWRNRADRANGKPYGARAVGLVQNDDRADWSEAYSLFPGEVAYVWHPPGARQVEFYNSLVASGFDVRMQIIWAKSHFPIGRGNYHVQHEPCWYAVRKGKTGHWSGDRKQTTLWQIPKPAKSETGHGTQKPVECMKRPIENNSSPGQAVYEPFSGSGTTIIAAEMTGRACHAIELSPDYVDVAVKRWQDFAGKHAVLDGDNRSFDDCRR